jgi:site-specific recombinase XerD
MIESVKQQLDESFKQQVIKEMQLTGLAASTQKSYLDIIVRFMRRTQTQPQDATEAQVADYLLGLINQGKCQGTIAPARSALKVAFQGTLQCKWEIFKKRSPLRVASVCPMPPAMPSVAASSPAFIARCPVFA